MTYWDSVGRWINTLLLFIVGVISFDTLFRLLEAQESNVIVGVTGMLAAIFLVPFRGMFGDQQYVLTALIAILGYAVLVGIALSVLRGLQATRVEPRGARDRMYPPSPGPPPQRPAAGRAAPRRSDAQPGRDAGRSPARKAPAGRGTTAGNPARTEPTNRNGRTPAPPARGGTPRRPDATAPAPPARGGTPRRPDATAPRLGDGQQAPGSNDGSPPRAADGSATRRAESAAARPDTTPSQRPNGVTADTAAGRQAEPVERDVSDD